jgi:hypothetical protein
MHNEPAVWCDSARAQYSREREIQESASRGIDVNLTLTDGLTMRRVAGLAFVWASLFPWVSFGTNAMDSQPWPLATALLYLLTSVHVGIAPSFLGALVLVPSTAAVGLLTSPELDFAFYRALFGYASIPVLLIASYVYIKSFGIPLGVFQTANVIYLGVATLQQVFGPAITGSLVTVRTTAGRGMPSLAVEPTYFGMLLIFFSWIICLRTAYRPRGGSLVLVLVNLAYIIFVAKSSMAILFLGVAATFVVAYRFRPGVYSILGAGVAVVIAGYNLFLQNTRIANLLNMLQAQGVEGLLLTDASINVRVAHVVIPWYASIIDVFVPHGFHAFSEAFRASRSWHGGLFWYAEDANTIMSYVGAFIFELGVVGLGFLVYLFALPYRNNRTRIFELLFLFVLLNSAIPQAFPLAPWIVAILYFTVPAQANDRSVAAVDR